MKAGDRVLIRNGMSEYGDGEPAVLTKFYDGGWWAKLDNGKEWWNLEKYLTHITDDPDEVFP